MNRGIRRLSRAERALFVAPLLVLLFALGATRVHPSLWWNAHNPAHDEIQRLAYTLAGENAVDCGEAQVGSYMRADYLRANGCAANAFHKGEPFVVRYNVEGMGPLYATTLVQTPRKEVYELTPRPFGPLTRTRLRHPHLRFQPKNGTADIVAGR